MSKFKIGGLVAFLVVCLVCIITSMISINCLADKKNQCAQVSGIMAVVMGSVACALLAVAGVGKRAGAV